MPYKIAVASTDGQAVDAHFGRTDRFYIYEVDDGGAYSQVDVRGVQGQPEMQGGCGGCRDVQARPEVSGGCNRHDEQGIKPLTDALSDCRYVLAAQIGKRPQMLLKRAGITALESPPELSEAISKLHKYYIKTNKEKNRNER